MEPGRVSILQIGNRVDDGRKPRHGDLDMIEGIGVQGESIKEVVEIRPGLLGVAGFRYVSLADLALRVSDTIGIAGSLNANHIVRIIAALAHKIDRKYRHTCDRGLS